MTTSHTFAVQSFDRLSDGSGSLEMFAAFGTLPVPVRRNTVTATAAVPTDTEGSTFVFAGRYFWADSKVDGSPVHDGPADDGDETLRTLWRASNVHKYVDDVAFDPSAEVPMNDADGYAYPDRPAFSPNVDVERLVMNEAKAIQYTTDTCPGCAGPITYSADNSGGVTVDFHCANASCEWGKHAV